MSSPIISNRWLSVGILVGTLGCQSSTPPSRVEQLLYHQGITYPFPETHPIGVNGKPKKVVIRTRANDHEYVIEIPDGGDEFNIEVPLREAMRGGKQRDATEIPADLSHPLKTDQEWTAEMPRVEDAAKDETALVDKAFGVGAKDGLTASPSFTLGVSKIHNYFKAHQYTYALVEVNHLLQFYPQSVRLHKMKGTLYVKLGEWKLADQAWQQAAQLAPNDSVIQKARQRIASKIIP
ncbi:MAG: hypothetical protein OXT67_10805 [Zetaproteobacteria bacterium]|nr:hypothetical protein [Zetaproteobacteria bacterium]